MVKHQKAVLRGKIAVISSDLGEFASKLERHTSSDGEHKTDISGLMLYRASKPSDLAAVVYEPSLCVVGQGAKEVRLASVPHRYDPAHSLLVSVDLPVETRVVEASQDRPCLVAVLSLDLAVVGEILADGIPALPVKSSLRGLSVSPIEWPLIDAVYRLVDLLDSPQDVGHLSPLILREITYRLLTGIHGSRLRQIASSGAPAHRIACAIRWLKDHFAEPLQVESLAKHVRMSPSALHLHFKNVTALSPLQYQKRLRLQEARRLMLAERFDAAEAAFRVGYESPSQFGREYRRMFGASPRKDVTALKIETQQADQSSFPRRSRITGT
jgi:AraC-like DNA-binding protein